MNPFQQLMGYGSPEAPALRTISANGTPRTMSRTQAMRMHLIEHGSATAHTLCVLIDLDSDSGRVGALLKNDIAKGRIYHRGNRYHWCSVKEQALAADIERAVKLLKRNGYTVTKEPS
jgi:predicted ArsR family transcriptional regulator